MNIIHHRLQKAMEESLRSENGKHAFIWGIYSAAEEIYMIK